MSIGLTYTKPTDLVTPIAVASAFTAIDLINAGVTSHMRGDADQTVPGVVRHAASAIKQGNVTLGVTLDGSSVNPGDQGTMNNLSASAFYALIGANAGTSWGGRVATFVASSGGLTAMLAQLNSHSHTDAATGGKLVQANTHQSADTDSGLTSIHHTLGTGAFQAATGNHLHTGTYVPVTDKGAASGVATLDGSTLIPVAQIPSSIARITDLTSGYVPLSQRAAASGVATLDGSSLIPIAQIPGTIARTASTSVLGHVHGTGSEVQITNAGIADSAVTGGSGAGAKIAVATVNRTNLAEGYVTAQGSPNKTVVVSAYTYFNSTLSAQYTVSGTTEAIDAVNALPTAGLQRFDLLYADDAGAMHWKAGVPAVSAPGKPMPDNNTRPLAWAGPITSATIAITSGMLFDARQSPTAAATSGTGPGTDLSGKPFFTYHSDGTLTSEMDLFTWLDTTTSTAPDATDLSAKRIDPSRMKWNTGGATVKDAFGVSVSPSILTAVSLGGTTAQLRVNASVSAPVFITNGTLACINTANADSNATTGGAGQRWLFADLAASGGITFTLVVKTSNTIAANQVLIGTMHYDGTSFQLGTLDLTPVSGIVGSAGYQPTVGSVFGAGGTLNNAIVYPTMQTITGMTTVTIYLPVTLRYRIHVGSTITLPAASVPTVLVQGVIDGGLVGLSSALATTPSLLATPSTTWLGTLGPGVHTFTVQAAQSAGNAPTVQNAYGHIELYR